MNANQAKELDFPALLSHLGFEPVKVTKGGRELWYRSPFRAEKEPSFHTSFINGKWIWNDFGDSGGNIIDFVMRYEHMNTLPEVLNYLRQLHPSGRSRARNPDQRSFFSFQKANHRTFDSSDDLDTNERRLEFIEAHRIKHPAIYAYLENERKIPADLAGRYLREVKYWNKDKGRQFFAFGMENRSGGYEIRAASSSYNFKSALKTRDITHIEGRAGCTSTVNVFEGMTDFLSLLVLLNTDELRGDAIIMHSVSSYPRTADFIQERAYKRINTFLDNNKSGRKATERLAADFKGIVFNQSSCFMPYEDLNDALRAGHNLSVAPNHDPKMHP